jgi:hypothetical protein
VPALFWTVAHGPTPHGLGPLQGWLERLVTTSVTATAWPDAYRLWSVCVVYCRSDGLHADDAVGAAVFGA